MDDLSFLEICTKNNVQSVTYFSGTEIIFATIEKTINGKTASIDINFNLKTNELSVSPHIFDFKDAFYTPCFGSSEATPENVKKLIDASYSFLNAVTTFANIVNF